MTPCDTIVHGIAQAMATAGKTTIYVAPGTYADPVTLQNGIGVSGGWSVTGQTWMRDCNAADVQIVVSSNPIVVQAMTLTTATTIDTLTIQNARTAGPGESLYGVFSVGSTLVLNEVAITVAAGGAGPGGAPGSAGAPGTAAGTCATGTGAAGPTGSAGTAGAEGAYGASGYAATTGAAGGAGSAGSNGALATSPNCGPATACPPMAPCSPPLDAGTVCISASGPQGCGGGAGGDGTGGGGGGASIGLFAWGGTATLLNGVVTAGAGGAGGQGAAGGQGGAGTAGTHGPCSPSGPTDCHYDMATMLCVPNAEMQVCGPTGGTGGNGGGGGGGGGGAGGDSYAYYAGGGAMVTHAGTSLMPGPGGTGGAGGSPNGQSGPTGVSLPNN